MVTSARWYDYVSRLRRRQKVFTWSLQSSNTGYSIGERSQISDLRADADSPGHELRFPGSLGPSYVIAPAKCSVIMAQCALIAHLDPMRPHFLLGQSPYAAGDVVQATLTVGRS